MIAIFVPEGNSCPSSCSRLTQFSREFRHATSKPELCRHWSRSPLCSHGRMFRVSTTCSTFSTSCVDSPWACKLSGRGDASFAVGFQIQNQAFGQLFALLLGSVASPPAVFKYADRHNVCGRWTTQNVHIVLGAWPCGRLTAFQRWIMPQFASSA